MILVAYGTRPEVIKLFPVIRELRRRGISHKTLFSGQHTGLYEDVKDLVPSHDYTFADSPATSRGSTTLGNSFMKICKAAERLFHRNRFDVVVVQGDTTTAWALAQMAFYNGVGIAHVEAGLRTFNLASPYPEEANRALISQLADYNFAPTRRSMKILESSGARNPFLVGNTVVDAVRIIREEKKIRGWAGDTVVVTLHRRENHKIMSRLFDEVDRVARENPDLRMIVPIHPNPNVRKHRGRLKAANIDVIDPVGYIEMLRMIGEARFLISDSGGIQEEASCFNKKILVVRDTTERPEILDAGLGRLVGADIRPHVPWAKEPVEGIVPSPFGDGYAAERIVSVLTGNAAP
ncbi:non-hydrolyzing UDP-N-acetylglucosamine 2-epimerase [Candidatus Deferrimicrobium sp.]|uniref:non-hydrolyzing UDP-N-acetylglucosamine 2-epimerase n=1 Tax=Candidatus Deferrimicrobium sp. TaxID=3060586 RepID=UPI002ED61B2E